MGSRVDGDREDMVDWLLADARTLVPEAGGGESRSWSWSPAAR